MIIGASGRQRAGVVRHEQRAALGGHVLDALLLDPEPVAVVEVEQRLHQREDALRAAPVVERAAGVGRRGSARAAGAGRGRRAPPRTRHVARQLVEVGARDRTATRGSGLLGSCFELERPAEQRAVRAQSPTTSWRSPSSSSQPFLEPIPRLTLRVLVLAPREISEALVVRVPGLLFRTSISASFLVACSCVKAVTGPPGITRGLEGHRTLESIDNRARVGGSRNGSYTRRTEAHLGVGLRRP